MTGIDSTIAALTPKLSATLLALSQDGATANLTAHAEMLLEAAQDLHVAVNDPASPPTYTGWASTGQL